MNSKYAIGVMSGCLFYYLTSSALADTMTSTNYKISWHVSDGGGGTMMSGNFAVTDSAGQDSPVGAAASVNYVVQGGFETPPDDDNDRVKSFMDNCTFDQNSTQFDSNGDGFGNLCDPDLDDSGIVNFADYAMLTAAFLSTPGTANWNPDADLTGDHVVNFGDIALFQFFFLGSPGPSGIAP